MCMALDDNKEKKRWKFIKHSKHTPPWLNIFFYLFQELLACCNIPAGTNIADSLTCLPKKINVLEAVKWIKTLCHK